VKKKLHASLHVTKMELTSFVNFAAEKFEARFEKVCSYLKEFTHAAKSKEIKDSLINKFALKRRDKQITRVYIFKGKSSSLVPL
jgi:hypothetical protein